MNDYFKDMKTKLDKLHRIQWEKKRQLRFVVAQQASVQRRLHHNKVIGPEGHPGAEYVPARAVQSFSRYNRTISKLSKDLQHRRVEIRVLESQVAQMKMTVSRDAYFQHKDGDIHGIHAVGIKGPDGEFIQEEIWGNTYFRNRETSKFEMKGGSFRVFQPFDEEVTSYETRYGPWTRIQE